MAFGALGDSAGVRVILAAAEALSDAELTHAVGRLQQMLGERGSMLLGKGGAGRGGLMPGPPVADPVQGYSPYGAVPPPPPHGALVPVLATGIVPSPPPVQLLPPGGVAPPGDVCTLYLSKLPLEANPDGLLSLGQALAGFQFLRFKPVKESYSPACWFQFDNQVNCSQAYTILRQDRSWAEESANTVRVDFGHMNMSYPNDGRDAERGFYRPPGPTGGMPVAFPPDGSVPPPPPPPAQLPPVPTGMPLGSDDAPIAAPITEMIGPGLGWAGVAAETWGEISNVCIRKLSAEATAGALLELALTLEGFQFLRFRGAGHIGRSGTPFSHGECWMQFAAPCNAIHAQPKIVSRLLELYPGKTPVTSPGAFNMNYPRDGKAASVGFYRASSPPPGGPGPLEGKALV